MPLPLLHRLPRGDRRALARAGTTLTALALARALRGRAGARADHARCAVDRRGDSRRRRAGRRPVAAARCRRPRGARGARGLAGQRPLSNAVPPAPTTTVTTAAAPVAPPTAAPAAAAAPPAPALAPGQPPARATTTLAAAPATAFAAPIPLPNADADLVLEAREALRRRDRERLAATRNAAMDVRHPLAVWLDYWELGNRLAEVQQDELEAFYARWPGSYRRGPAAQRLAARARPPARLGALRAPSTRASA